MVRCSLRVGRQRGPQELRAPDELSESPRSDASNPMGSRALAWLSRNGFVDFGLVAGPFYAFRDRVGLEHRRVEQHVDTLLGRSRANLRDAGQALERVLDALLATLTVEPLIADDLEGDGLEHDDDLRSYAGADAVVEIGGVRCPTVLIAWKK